MESCVKGRLVELRWPAETDWERVAGWVKPLSASAVLSGDTEVVTADDVRNLNRSGAVRHLMIIRAGTGSDSGSGSGSGSGVPIGMVSWRSSGCPGGYSLGSAVGDPALWSRGYGAEATALLVDLLFHQLNAHRLQIVTATYNRHSLQVMTRGAFVLEGILRRYYFLDGEYHDAAVWSMLREEFYAQVSAARKISADFDVLELVRPTDKAAARQALSDYLQRGGPSAWHRHQPAGHPS